VNIGKSFRARTFRNLHNCGFSTGSESPAGRSGSSLHTGNCRRMKATISRGIALGLMPDVILPELLDPVGLISALVSLLAQIDQCFVSVSYRCRPYPVTESIRLNRQHDVVRVETEDPERLVVPHDIGKTFLRKRQSKADSCTALRSSAQMSRWRSLTWTG